MEKTKYKFSLIVSFICIYSISVSQGTKKHIQEDFKIKIGVNWYCSNDSITGSVLENHIPEMFQNNFDKKMLLNIVKYEWVVSNGIIGPSGNGIKPNFAELPSGTVVLLSNIIVSTQHNNQQYPKYFRLYIK